jgi:hypothetical protein
MKDPQTCGKGLAERAALPAKLAELVGALAENLELHQKTLDFTDPPSKTEYDAYVSLAKQYRGTETQLGAAAKEMAGYRDLPMGRHDQQAMANPKIRDAFTRFVTLERELLKLLQGALKRDAKMLDQMSGQPRRRSSITAPGDTPLSIR